MLFKDADDDSIELINDSVPVEDSLNRHIREKVKRINRVEELEKKHAKSTIGMSQLDSYKLSASNNSKNIQDKYLVTFESKTRSHNEDLPAPERSTNSDSSQIDGQPLSSCSKVIENMYREKLEKFRNKLAEKSNESCSSIPKLGKRGHSKMRMTEAVPF